MKKNKIILIMIIAIFAVSICGCKNNKVGSVTVKAGENAIYINKDGKVSYAISEKFDKDYYNKDELKQKMNDEIDKYNSGSLATKDKAVKLDSFKVKNSEVSTVIKFESVEDYVNYVKEYNAAKDNEIYIGSITEAIDEGFKFDKEFIKINDKEATNKTADGEEIEDLDDNVIIITEKLGATEKFMIELESEIMYISTNCDIKDGVVTITDDNMAYIVYK